MLRLLFGNIGQLGLTQPGSGFTDLQAMAVELLLTVGLVSVILGTASSAQNVGPLSALAVGGYIVLAGLWSSPVSGASMNPARSFGPALVTGDFTPTGCTSPDRSRAVRSRSASPTSCAAAAAMPGDWRRPRVRSGCPWWSCPDPARLPIRARRSTATPAPAGRTTRSPEPSRGRRPMGTPSRHSSGEGDTPVVSRAHRGA